MSVKIKMPNEALVDIKRFCPGILVKIDKKRLKIEKTAWVRQAVAKKLKRAQKLLPSGMNFVIRDAWRPPYIQAKIYFAFLAAARKRFPTTSSQDIRRQVQKYVAPWKGSQASGHLTGGAVDIRITDKNGRRLPMISRKKSYQENALPGQKNLPAHLRKNRQLLFDVLTAVGFSNNIREYWHWSYGDYYWAKKNKRRPLYGMVTDKKNLYSKKLCPCGSGKKFKNCHGK